MTDQRWRGVRALALLSLLALAACEPSPGERAAPTGAGGAPGSIDLATAEWVVREYFDALGERRTEEARALLAAGLRSDTEPQEMAAAARELAHLEVSELAVEEVAPERIVFRSNLRVVPDPQYPGSWQPGVNTRWIEVVHSRRGWRIAEVATEPLPASWSPVRMWTPVHVLEAEISVDVPHGWQRREGEWAWSPSADGWPHVGLSRREARESGVDEVALPRFSRVLRSATVELEWGNGTQYTLELPGSADGCGAPSCYEHTLTVMDRFGRSYTFFTRTARSDELRPLLAVLRRMYRSAELPTAATLSARASGPECRGVTPLSPGSTDGEILAAQLRALLPAGVVGLSRTTPVLVSRITRLDRWSLLEFSVTGDGHARIALLRERGGSAELAGLVASAAEGDPAVARAELLERVPDAPAALFRCVELTRRDDRQP